jgi:hypothetical protein
MTDTVYTNHASSRLRQRGINVRTIEFLEKYGMDNYAPGGALRISLTRRNAKKIIDALKRDIHFIERACGTVIIKKEGEILTAYHKQ